MVNFVSTYPNLALAIALVIFVLLLAWVIYLTVLIKTYLRDKRGILKEVGKRGIDQVLRDLQKQIKKLNLDTKELYNISDQLSKIAIQSIIKVGIIRYNPFGDAGGDQSFSIALLNSNDDGLVISSLHGREGTRVYSKPIEEGKSKYHLSDEEIEVMKKAQGQ